MEPVVNSPCRVPIALKDEIKAELASMERQSVMEKVREGQPTDQVSCIVYQRMSNGKLWICLNKRDLNTTIKQEHHLTPTLEDIIPKISGEKYFSTIDAKMRFLESPVDEQSSFLTTLNSPYGRDRFKQMPFGLKMSQDVFQARIDQLVKVIAWAVATESQTTTLSSSEWLKKSTVRTRDDFLRIVASTGWSWTQARVKSVQPEAEFYGLINSAGGVRPDLRKALALHSMSTPTRTKNFYRFLVRERIWGLSSQI